MPMKSILIASDLSARSDRALQRGFLLARQVGARVTVAAIIDDTLPGPLATDLAARCRAHLDASARSMGEDVPHDIHVEIGDPVPDLVALVNAADVDLAVFGRHRDRGVLDGLRQTTVESVVSQSLTPVLLVTDPAHGPYTRVLAPVSFSSACRQAVTTALRLAPDATLRTFHAWMAPYEGLTGGQTSDYARAVRRETEEQATAWSKGLPATLERVVLVHESVGPACEREIATFSPDLIAVGANTRSLSFTGLGSFTAGLLRAPPTDLVIARGAEF